MFFATTFGALILCATQLALSVAVLVLAFVDYDEISGNISEFYGTNYFGETFFKTIVMIQAIFMLIGTILTGHLFAFHVFLSYRGQLTHEFLMGDTSSAQSHQPKPSIQR
jgi:hypothetical protein